MRWMLEREARVPAGGILADDVGLGKTYAVAGLMRASPLRPTLVVVPKSCLWHWAGVLSQHSGDFPVVVHKPSAAAAALGADLVVASYSCLQAAAGGGGPPALRAAIMERAWGRVVLDEAHEVRNPKTRAHRAALALKAHARWALTATPVQNHAGDLAALARFVGAPADDLATVRAEYVLRRSADPASLPGLTVRDVVLDLVHKEERELYASVRIEAARHLRASRDVGGAGGGASSGPAWEMLLRCRQACTHPALYHHSMAGKRGLTQEAALGHLEAASAAGLRSTKVEYLCDRLQETAGPDGEKSIVFCDWRREMQLVAEAMEARGLPEPVLFHGGLDVQARDCATLQFADADGGAVLLLQTACGACGLNLQVASRVYVLRPQWNPAVELQAIGRAHRSGQIREVVVTRLIARGTVDERALRTQRDKLSGISKVLLDDTMERRLDGGGCGGCGADTSETSETSEKTTEQKTEQTTTDTTSEKTCA